jgi:uncharacterized HAD superfamily protein
MKIGIDLDEVIVDLLDLFLHFYYIKKGKKFSKKDFFTYNFWEVFDEKREDTFKMTHDFYDSDMFDKAKPISGSIKSVNLLADKNDIFIITSRPERWKEKTEAWIKRYFGNIKYQIFYSSEFHKESKKTKDQLCAGLSIDVMIEDIGDFAIQCANLGINVILFDKPWNKKVKHDNIIRVKNWNEAINTINKIL